MSTLSKDPQQLAFERHLEAIQQVSVEDLIHLNRDIPSLISTVRAVVVRTAPFSSVIASLPLTDHVLLGRMADLAEGLSYIHSRVISTTRRVVEVAPLAEEAETLLAIFNGEFQMLFLRKVLPESTLPALDTTRGYKPLAANLRSVATFAQENWAKIESRCSLTAEDIKRAVSLHSEILGALGERTNDDKETLALVLLRNQTFTLLVQAYEELRHAMHYIRYKEGDADALVPSFYATRSGRSRKQDGTEETGSTPFLGGSPAEPAPEPPPISKGGPFR